MYTFLDVRSNTVAPLSSPLHTSVLMLLKFCSTTSTKRQLVLSYLQKKRTNIKAKKLVNISSLVLKFNIQTVNYLQVMSTCIFPFNRPLRKYMN